MGAHGTFALLTSSCSQASAHVARHDGAAGRRKTARRQEVVGSVDERSAVGVIPSAPHPRQVRRGLVAKARAGAIPKRAVRVKGGGVSQDTSRTATQIGVALLAEGIPSVEARTGRRHRRGRGSGAQSVVPARRKSGCRLHLRSSLPFECRKADRAASSWQTTSSRSQDTAGELLRVNAANRAKEGISGRG